MDQQRLGHGWSRKLGLGVVAWCTMAAAAAEEGNDGVGKSPVPPDKSGYHLFNPTPRELMREMSTDRPDKTESPYSVDAGHMQIEMDFVTYTRDHDTSGGADTETESWMVAPINLKVGVANWADLQFVVESYQTVRTKDRTTGAVVRNSGFGDLTIRFKANLWGNDGGPTALAAMPYVKVPTNQDDLGNDAVEGGLILPLAIELPWGWGMGVMPQFDVVRDDVGNGHHGVAVNTLTLGHDIVGKLAGYVEFFSEVNLEGDAPWVGTIDLGLTYALTDDIQLDGGVNLGVTRSADDVNPFLGLSVRF